MALKDAIANFLGKTDCEKLVRYDGRVLDLGALSAEIGGAKFSLASFKTHLEKVREASDAALAMDDYQYNICKIAAQYDKGSKERIRYNNWRIGAIGYFTSLRMILASLQSDPSEELKERLQSAIEDMHDFVKAIAEAVAPPKPRPSRRGSARVAHVETEKTDILGSSKSVERAGSYEVMSDHLSAPKEPAAGPSRQSPLSRAFLAAGLTETEVKEIASRA